MILVLLLVGFISNPYPPPLPERPQEYYVKKIQTEFRLTNKSEIYLNGKRTAQWPPPVGSIVERIEVDGDEVLKLYLIMPERKELPCPPKP